MKEISEIFKHNQQWAEEKQSIDHDFFKNLAQEQHPDYLWIGCSDSRVPANEVTDLGLGELRSR